MLFRHCNAGVVPASFRHLLAMAAKMHPVYAMAEQDYAHNPGS
jgi:hypothetical protein